MNFNSSLVSFNGFSVSRSTGTQIDACRGFEVHDLLTCESKVQVVASLGSLVRPRKLVNFDP